MGATNGNAARIGHKQTRRAEKRSAVSACLTRASRQAVSPHFLSLPKSLPVLLFIQCTASKPGKQSLEIRSLSRSPYHHRSISGQSCFGRASKSEGVHISFVLFEFTAKRCTIEASAPAIPDLKGDYRDEHCARCPLTTNSERIWRFIARANKPP